MLWESHQIENDKLLGFHFQCDILYANHHMKCNTEYKGAIAMDNIYLEFVLYGVEMSL